MLKPHLPENFFDEFYRTNPSLQTPHNFNHTSNNINSVHSDNSGGAAYSICIQVNPEQFDPVKWEIISEEVKQMMKRLNHRLDKSKEKHIASIDL